ncbi:MAG: BamA/TamA family outer membrane protein [bacterium]|nr:BamA/TamA family outer membrane protein [bacterium]
MYKNISILLIFLSAFSVVYSKEQSENPYTALIEKRLKKNSGKTLIDSVEIKGNKSVKTAVILRNLSIKPGKVFNPVLVKQNIKNINSSGFFSEVTSSVENINGHKKVIFQVKENPRIKKIIFENNTLINDETLLSIIDSKPDMILNLVTIRKDMQSIGDLYIEKGFSYAKVYGTKYPAKEGDPLVFKIMEGKIDEIIITGNKLTQDYVIRREMQIQPGMAIKNTLLKEDLRRIYNLNYFSAMEPGILSGDTPQTYKLRIDLVERPTNASINFGGGYSPITQFTLFSDVFWDNVMGSGQHIMLRGQFGMATTYQVKYHNPWFWDERKSLTLRTWITDGRIGTVNPLQGANQIDFRNERRKGVDVTFGWPISYELRTAHSLKYESVNILEKNKGYKIHSYRINLSNDTRDVFFNPSEGDNQIISIEKGFKLEKSSLDFTKYFVGIRKFIKTFEKQTIALRFDFDYLTSP